MFHYKQTLLAFVTFEAIVIVIYRRKSLTTLCQELFEFKFLVKRRENFIFISIKWTVFNEPQQTAKAVKDFPEANLPLCLSFLVIFCSRCTMHICTYCQVQLVS